MLRNGIMTTLNNTDKKIKVLQIITVFSIGGATENVVAMADGLNNIGYKVDILTGLNIKSEGSMYETAQKLNISVYTFKCIKRNINPLFDIIATYKIYRFIKKNKYDIVHTHSSKAGVIGRIAARLANTKAIIHSIRGLPFHNYQNKILHKFLVLIEKIISKFCHKITAVSYTIIETLTKRKIVDSQKLIMIRSAFDIKSNLNLVESKIIKEKYSIKDDEIVIGKIARLSKLKGIYFALESIKRVSKIIPKIKFLIVGNGELESEIRKYIEDNNLSNIVILTGLISPEEIPSYINTFDFLIHTSLLEGLARVIPQSIVMGKPVICFNLDGSHEIIRDGRNGFLIEPENIEHLTQKIIEMCKDKNKIKIMGEIDRQLIFEEYSVQKMIQKLNDLYLSLI
ncbi:MAG: glycosyltransferase family 4 protein [Candidatus Lokiarchaeota archaeon]|nr:glycosyltransferase family 4 protein [Candidatus Lokiarchaeota archaeon]